MVEVTFVSAGAREDDPASTLLLTTLDPLRGAPGKEVASGGAPAVGACCGAGGGGRFGACLFFLLRLSTDTFAALSSAPLSRLVGGEEVVKEVRWIRNCSAMSLNSFLICLRTSA